MSVHISPAVMKYVASFVKAVFRPDIQPCESLKEYLLCTALEGPARLKWP